MAAQMAKQSCRWPPPQLLVPISLHRQRLRYRGFDQAVELTKQVARQLQVPWGMAIRRVRATTAQSQLTGKNRLNNVQSAFAAIGSIPERVTLVDDVMTTGATARSAAQMLRQCGARQVDVWVCARAERPGLAT